MEENDTVFESEIDVSKSASDLDMRMTRYNIAFLIHIKIVVVYANSIERQKLPTKVLMWDRILKSETNTGNAHSMLSLENFPVPNQINLRVILINLSHYEYEYPIILLYRHE